MAKKFEQLFELTSLNQPVKLTNEWTCFHSFSYPWTYPLIPAICKRKKLLFLNTKFTETLLINPKIFSRAFLGLVNAITKAWYNLHRESGKGQWIGDFKRWLCPQYPNIILSIDAAWKKNTNVKYNINVSIATFYIKLIISFAKYLLFMILMALCF